MNRQHLQPLPVLPYACRLGESPLWDIAQQRICWVDILEGTLHQYDPRSKGHTMIDTGQMLGAIGLCRGGNLIAAFQNGFGYIDRLSHQIQMIADPETHLPGNRFNEGKCTPGGEFWAGTLSLDETPNAGSLYCLQPGGTVIKKLEGLTISNGMAWSPDFRVFYFIDSPAREITAFDYHLKTGAITNPRTAIHTHHEKGFPDGMTIDTEGMLWIAFWGGGNIIRWDPRTGKKLLEIDLPVSQVSSCSFGGPQLEDLYITTATKDLEPGERNRQPLAGHLFRVKDCGFRGFPCFYFNEGK